MANTFKGVFVFQLCECDAVAARTKDEALEWYKKHTGLNNDELYEYDDIELVELTYKVRESEENDHYITVGEIIERYWSGQPFIVFSSYN